MTDQPKLKTPFYRKVINRYKQEYKKRPKTVITISSILSIGILACLGILILVIGVGRGWSGELPTYAELKTIKHNTASEIYSADKVLLGKYYRENRVTTSFAEISPNVINALVATEDARFYEHKGIDYRAWIRVFFKTILLSDQSGGGGSTISQQIAKNLYPRKRYNLLSTPINKVREMYIARRLEKTHSKNDLLNLYLNTVSFSDNVFGIQVASKRFFNKSPSELKMEEAAVLVGMLKATTYYDPKRNPAKALERRNIVLNQLGKYEFISLQSADSLKQLSLKLDYIPESHTDGLATYFREHLRVRLPEMLKGVKNKDGTPYNVYTDGLRINTTINAKLQRYAEQAVKSHMTELQKKFESHWEGPRPWETEKEFWDNVKNSNRYKSLTKAGMTHKACIAKMREPVPMTVFSHKGEKEVEWSPLDSIKYYYALLNAGFLATDPTNGQILTWVGGVDHKYVQYDHVKSKRQVGSTFKPFVYASGLQQGLAPCEYYDNLLITYSDYDDWRPENANGEYGGYYSMEGALCNSVNAVSVDIIMKTGTDRVIQLAKNAGIQSKIPPVPSIALGTTEANLIDMVGAFGAFANNGVHNPLWYVNSIEDKEGNIIYRSPKRKSQEALDINTNAMMTRMMQTVVDSGTAKRLRYQYNLVGPIAGKTGTTQSHADGWFIGYTPKIVGGAWVGASSPSVHFRTLDLGQGGRTALPIWGEFMRLVQKDYKLKKYNGGQFTSISDSIYIAMDCDPFVLEKPSLLEEIYIVEEDNGMDKFLKIFKRKRGEDGEIIHEEQRINTSKGTLSEKQVEIKKRNEQIKRKREKKKKRKQFWDKVFRRKK